MKILVCDVAAQDGGSLQVLKHFHADACRRQDVQWIFLTSCVSLEEKPHLRVLSFSWIKHSWLHRLWFDHVKQPALLRRLKPDLVISLQNMPLWGCRCRQFVYLHQSLQFCPKRFSFFRKEERSLAVRQRLIGWLIRSRMPRADHIFVQTQWIREATALWLGRKRENITVVPVTVDEVPEAIYAPQRESVFFYPARAEQYKNHALILEACRELAKQNITGYKVIFTLTAEDGPYAERLARSAVGLPVEFIGTVPHEKIWAHYTHSVLLFPSYLETCGLPLLEAKAVGGRILASDMPFSREALDGYPNAGFFPQDDPICLARQMKELLEGKPYTPVERQSTTEQRSLLTSMLQTLQEN